MLDIIEMLVFIALGGFLYRWGGGGFNNLPKPLNQGFKPARRYILPAMIAITTSLWIPMAVFSMILHFNLKEIEDRRWDDIALYGFAQAWCFAESGIISIIIGLSWIVGVYLSNIGLCLCKNIPIYKGIADGKSCGDPKKLDWFFVELIHGAIVGFAWYCLFK